MQVPKIGKSICQKDQTNILIFLNLHVFYHSNTVDWRTNVILIASLEWLFTQNEEIRVIIFDRKQDKLLSKSDARSPIILFHFKILYLHFQNFIFMLNVLAICVIIARIPSEKKKNYLRFVFFTQPVINLFFVVKRAM